MSSTARLGAFMLALAAASSAFLDPVPFTPTSRVLAQEPSPSERPQFRTSVDIFQVEATVLDDKRQSVTGLTRDDFTVLEDGKPQPIVSFSEVMFPKRDGPLYQSEEIAAPDVQSERFADRRLFCLVIDDFGLPYTPGTGFAQQGIAIPEVKRVAREFIMSMGPKDFAAVVMTKDPRYFPDFTSRYAKLTAAIENFSPPGEAERAILEQATRGRVGLMPALEDVVNYMAKLPQHRKTIIYIGVGNPMSEEVLTRRADTGAAVNGHAREIAQKAAREGIQISSINVSSDLRTHVGPLPASADFLRMLADDTGGYAGSGWHRSEASVAQLFHETQSYYLLGYQRTTVFDGRFRSVDVRVRPRGLHVYARKGVIDPKRDDAFVKAPAPAQDDALGLALRKLDRDEDDRGAGIERPTEWLGPAMLSSAAMNPRAQFQPVADFQVLRAERLRVRWALLKPVDVRRIRLLRRAGDPLSFAPPLSVDDVGGQPCLATEFPLGSLAAGDYVIELVAGDSTSTGRTLVPFRVLR